MFKSLRYIFLIVLLASPLRAGTPEQLQTLLSALRMEELMQIMAEEGAEHGKTMEQTMFAGRGGARWAQMVAAIYDPAQMQIVMSDEMQAGLADTDLTPLIAFLTSDRGARIIKLELAARRALMDPALEQAAQDRLEDMQADRDPRLALLSRFSRANDLIEMNVTGAMNANLAFYSGLAAGGAMPSDLSEGDLLDMVWAQEDELRADTGDWLASYLMLAYDPLSDEDLGAYIDLSETPGGQALNRAMFAAFDVLLVGISHDLGQGAAQFMLGQDI